MNVTAIEIDKKLRDDFRRRLKDFGISAESTDPVLAVLFRTFAQQLEVLYTETDRNRIALLDEFISGLRIEPRMARPAQTITGFVSETGSLQSIEAGTELNGQASTDERLVFMTDAPVSISGARLALAAVYQNEQLQLLPGVEMPEALQASRPVLDPVRVHLGPHPAIYLAIENLPTTHLSRHSLFFELGPDSFKLQEALRSDLWCLANSEGEFCADGILRSSRGNGGTYLLRWLVGGQEESSQVNSAQDTPVLRDGFYAGRIFVFPEVPRQRMLTCSMPRAMAPALAKIFGQEVQTLFRSSRAWIRISLPRPVPALREALSAIALHAMTASNVECLNQTIYFQRQGTSIPISQEAGTQRFLVAPLSILGESNSAYLPELQPSTDRSAGRYAVRNGRIELQPARNADGTKEAYANMRIWTTNGKIGNNVGPGAITGFARRAAYSSVRLTNPVSAAGGTNGENYQEARDRFAEALLSRDRIVTETDLVNAVRSFDRRILDAEISSKLERTHQGLKRVENVTVTLDRDAFTDPRAELSILQEDLLCHLRGRFFYNVNLSLSMEWQ